MTRLDPTPEPDLEAARDTAQGANEERTYDAGCQLATLQAALGEIAAESKRQADFHRSEAHRDKIVTASGESECRAYEEIYDGFALTITELLAEVLL